MNFFRFKTRLPRLLKSDNVAALADNITPNTFDAMAALPLLLYIISPALVLVFAFRMQLRLFIILAYPDFLASILPGILVLYGLTLMVLLVKEHRAGIHPLDRFFHQPVYVCFFIAMLWMLLSICINGWTKISLLGDWTRHEGLLTYWGYIGVLFFLGSLIRNDRIKITLCNISIAVSLAVAVFAVFHDCVFLPDVTVDDGGAASAIFFNSNHYGYYLGLHIMLAAALFAVTKTVMRKVIYLLAMAANVAVLNVNNTFGVWLACVFGFAFMMIVGKIVKGSIDRQVLPPFLVFIAISVGMSLAGCGILASFLQFFLDILHIAENPEKADDAGSSRWKLWKATARFIGRRPLFGYGIEGIGKKLEKAAGNSRTHNEYLQYAVTFGIPEAVCYTLGCIGVFIRNMKHKSLLKKGSFVCLTAAFTYLVSACFGITMYNIAPFFFIFLGLGYNSEKHLW